MLIFLDTETTGLTNTDRLCQVAYKTEQDVVCEYFKPPIPISLEAMSINHITNQMIINKAPFKQSATYYKLEDLFKDSNNILVCHNAKFDVDMLQRENLNPKHYICTKKLIQSADKKNRIEKYNLQYLRYYFNIELNDIVAHDALGDVLILEQLFFKIYKIFYKDNDKSKEQVLFELENITKNPLLLNNITFGKYKNQSFESISKNNIGYLKWLNNQSNINEDLQYTLDHYLKN